MQQFNIHILGCGSAKPTTRHYASSQVVEIRNKYFMIDCGEGTQTQICRMHISFTKIQAVFISHLHGDHCFGLIGMISSFGLQGRTTPLHIYAHSNLKPLLDMQLGMFCTNIGYDIVFHPIDPTESSTIFEDKSLAVSTIPLDHRIPCCGFLFTEKPTLPHIRRDMIDYFNIPQSQINNIKNGANWTTPDGTIVDNSRLVSPPDPVRSYAYCSDTKYSPSIIEQVKGVNLLYHEATYGDDKQDCAAKYFHSTARQAASIALQAKVQQLILGHYSARYRELTQLLKEARQVFPNTQLSCENMVVSVK